MTFREFVRHTQREPLAPVYLLTGEEAFLIQSALERLLESAVPAASRDFNVVQIDGKGANAESIVNELQSLPVLAERRLVVLKSADALSAAEASKLTGYLDDPSPSTCFVAVAPKTDGRRTFFQKLNRNHVTVDCRPLPESELPGWVRSQARSLGFDLAEDAAAFLIEQVGSDLFRLQNELAKAGLLSGPDKKITRENVLEVSRSGGKWAIPDLLEAVGERDAAKALVLQKDLLESGTAPLQILGALARHFRQLASAKQLLSEGVNEDLAMKRLNVWRSVWPRILRQVRAFGMRDLLFASRRCFETDAGIKGAAADGVLLMEELVVDVCAGEKRSLRRFLGRQELIYLDRQV